MITRETKNLEYKSEISNSFLKTVSAYANYGNGKIIFGIQDDKKIAGLSGDLEELCLILENKINDSIDPSPDYSLLIDEKEKTITLEVFEGLHKPYLYQKKAYKRADSATVPVDRLEYHRLILDGLNQNYEDLKSKNQNLSFKLLEKELIEKANIEVLNLDILKTLNLYSEKEGYNKAAELLADDNFCIGVDIVRFGESIDEFLYRETIEHVSVLELYYKSLEIFRAYYQLEVIEGSHRKIVEKIPEKAFREALANSLIHRTWDIPSPIRISMYQDKIEIASSGGLPNGISKEEYLNGQISTLRNPILGNVFFRLKYIEKFGTGIRRINQAYSNSIIKPEYQIFENSIIVCLPVFNENIEILSKDEKQLFDLLKGGRIMTRVEIERNSNIGKDKIIRVLNRLIEKNVVQKIGQGRGTKYKV